MVSRIGLGAMGMSHGLTGAGTDDAESIRTVHQAIDLGVTLLDTAEIYGNVWATHWNTGLAAYTRLVPIAGLALV